MNVGFLKRRLEELKIDEGDFADLCGVAESTMKKQILRGFTPGKPVLLLMAHHLGCRVHDFAPDVEMNPSRGETG